MVRRYGFGKDDRLSKPFEYKIVLEEGQRAATGHFVIYARRRIDGKKRIGISVGKKVGGAVVRNRIKRIFRETFRLNREKFPHGVDIVVIVRRNEGLKTLKDVESSFVETILSMNL